MYTFSVYVFASQIRRQNCDPVHRKEHKPFHHSKMYLWVQAWLRHSMPIQNCFKGCLTSFILKTLQCSLLWDPVFSYNPERSDLYHKHQAGEYGGRGGVLLIPPFTLEWGGSVLGWALSGQAGCSHLFKLRIQSLLKLATPESGKSRSSGCLPFNALCSQLLEADNAPLNIVVWRWLFWGAAAVSPWSHIFPKLLLVGDVIWREAHH